MAFKGFWLGKERQFNITWYIWNAPIYGSGAFQFQNKNSGQEFCLEVAIWKYAIAIGRVYDFHYER